MMDMMFCVVAIKSMDAKRTDLSGLCMLCCFLNETVLKNCSNIVKEV